MFSVDKIKGIIFNPISGNFIKWSNTLKQFFGNLPTNCFSVFDHFVKLALKGLNSGIKIPWLFVAQSNCKTWNCLQMLLIYILIISCLTLIKTLTSADHLLSWGRWPFTWALAALHKKWSFPLRISSLNVTKSVVSCNQIRIFGASCTYSHVNSVVSTKERSSPRLSLIVV